jgi:hypothetical protein
MARTDGGRPGPTVTVTGPVAPAEHLPETYPGDGPAAAAAADAAVLVVDRRTSGTRAEQPGETRVADRRVVAVPARPGARPSVDLYCRADPVGDPAVALLRQAVELDAYAAAHFRVASRLAVVGDDGTGDPDWATAGDDGPATGGRAGPGGDGDAVADAEAGPAGIPPSAAELRARRDSVDEATGRLLDAAAEEAAPLAFCGLSAVLDPLDGD